MVDFCRYWLIVVEYQLNPMNEDGIHGYTETGNLRDIIFDEYLSGSQPSGNWRFEGRGYEYVHSRPDAE